MSYFKHPSAFVDEGCVIGEATRIWHFCHIQPGAQIGKGCIFGQNVNVAGGVVIGDFVKIQNNVSIYAGTLVEDYVFLGPSCVLTNVTNPRAEVNRHNLYERTVIRRGASIGANATLVCGMTVGRYAFVAAGAVVAKNVPDYALIVGVPGRRTGWVSRHGLPLKTFDSDGVYRCPESGLRYREVEVGTLRCLDLDEETALPADMTNGRVYYDDLIHGNRLR